MTLPLRGDSTARVLDLYRSVPGLDPGFARHLVLDDDRAFSRYCRETGQPPIRDAYVKLDQMTWTAPPDSYLTRFHRLYPHLERMGQALATIYGNSECIRVLRFRRSLGPAGIQLNRHVDSLHSLQRGSDMDPDERIARFRRLIVEFERLAYEDGVLAVEGELARALSLRGEKAESAAFLNSALERARQLEDFVMVCQLLGDVGLSHRRAGNPDSMMACYHEGIATADRHRMPEQAARLRGYLATYYRTEGRLAVATDLFREAQDVARRWGGGPHQLRPILNTMDYFADMKCWAIVRGLSRRLPVLLRTLERTAHHHEFQIFSLRARRLEALLEAAEGRPGTAAAIQSPLREPVRRLHGPAAYGLLLEEIADVLLADRRPHDALEVIAEGIVHADSISTLTWLGSRLAMARVRAAIAVRDLEKASAALRDARRRLSTVPTATRLTKSFCDGLEVEIAAARGEGLRARRRLQASVLDLRRAVQQLDAGPDSYLALSGVENLRESAHRLLGGDPSSSYRFELDWRSLAGRLGRTQTVPTRGGEVRVTGLARGRSIHLVFGFLGDSLTRWTHRSGIVRREVLPLSLTDCDQRVDLAMRLFSRDPGSGDASVSDSLSAVCAELGSLLLPPEVLRGPPVRLVVSAEGSIARLPFEALSLGTGSGYEPLLARHDVVYARPVPPMRRGSGDGSSIVLLEADPGRGQGSPLASVESEGAQAIMWLPNARLVQSSQISKRDLLLAWSRASVLYVAAHLVRDPEAPLLCYFPMKFGARPDHLEDTYLDLLDARTVDLSGCDLAVLSSCASGEPYVVGGRAGPSMADALLDAGAGAVIHTRWQVRDDRAAVVAPRLAHAWLDTAHDPVRSWCAERRTALRGPNGWRHPFEWGAWSVTVGVPTTPWSAREGDLTVAAVRRAPSAHGRREGSGGPSGPPR